MLILLKYTSHLLSFNITATTYNLDLLHVRKKLEDSQFSTILCYRKNLDDKVNRLTTQKRKFKSILDIDPNLISQQCILIYHNDLFIDTNYNNVTSFVNMCQSLNKILVVQYNNDIEHLFCNVASSAIHLDSIDVAKSQDQSKLNGVIRELKITRLLT